VSALIRIIRGDIRRELIRFALLMAFCAGGILGIVLAMLAKGC
jgi:hypothetical protein